MSSTTGIQNLLVNVFRPVYRYETPTGDSNSIFVPKLTMSNIDTYSGNTVAVQTAAVGDSNSNVYVGSNAGNPYSNVKGCKFVSAFGYSAAAGISNVSNSVFVGYNAGAAATDISATVIIGAIASGGGLSNVRIGYSNVGTGNNNVSIGASTSGSSYSNCILLGTGITATQNNQFRVGSSYIWGDQSTKWLGIATPAQLGDPNSRLDISGNVYVYGQQGINKVPIRTLDVNGDFRSSDANGTLDFNLGNMSVSNATGTLAFTSGVTTSSGGLGSLRGTTINASVNSKTTIGTLKKGAILVSARDTTDSNHYQSRMVFCPSETDGSLVVDMTNSAQSGEISVIFPSSSSNIQISNVLTVRDIAWTVTYFPLP